jgi:hypothetical protein
LDIGDHGQGVALITLEERPGLLVVRGQEDLGPCHHPQHPMHGVDPLGHQGLRLDHQLGIQLGQEGRVATDRVLDHDDDLDSGARGVLGHVQRILDQLEDSQHDAGIPGPQEDSVQPTGELAMRQAAHLELVQNHRGDGEVGILTLDPLGQVANPGVVQPQGRQDQIHPTLAKELHGLLRLGDVQESGRGGQVQLGVFDEETLAQPPVLFDHVGVVVRRDQEDLPDPVRHEVMELEDPGVAPFRTGGWVHRRDLRKE